jgi:hypothetical protein
MRQSLRWIFTLALFALTLYFANSARVEAQAKQCSEPACDCYSQATNVWKWSPPCQGDLCGTTCASN